MKKYLLSLYTTSLFDLLRDTKNFSAVESVSCKVRETDGQFDDWIWSVEMTTDPYFEPSLLISMAYLSNREHILQRRDYKDFKLKLLLFQKLEFEFKKSVQEDFGLAFLAQ